ncbi:MAG: hypothetical protein QXD32_03060 [Nitrososphaerota archaeon]
MRPEGRSVSEALVRAAAKVYQKLPDMLGLDSSLSPEEIVARLKLFFDGSNDSLASQLVISYIINMALKELGHDGQPRLLILLGLSHP